MNRYERPMIIAYQDTAEGVYLASGGAADNSDTANNIKCDSQYMNGNWQAPDYSGWNGGTRGYRQQFGCLGCPAYTATACGLETIMWIRDMLEVTIPIMETASHPGKRKDMDRMIQ
ncbi:MAG: hypothetical protein ACLRP8_10185 [Roseburia intestinalis]